MSYITVIRPAIVKEEHLQYLESLQRSGVTNMFGAADYLRVAYNMNLSDAKEVLLYWMESYDERHP